MKKAIFYILILSFNLLAYSNNAQNLNPCNSEAHRAFDFWIGEWDVYDAVGDTIVGYNHVKQILNSCVIEENWTGASGFKGKSFNTYNPVDSTWNQVWVDMSGVTYHFSGAFIDGVMDLSGNTVMNGKQAWFSLKFRPNKKDGTVRQTWRLTYDKKTWATLFDGIYRKRKKVK